MITFVVCRDKICPICKKPFALKETSKEVISKENISVQIENKIRNREGKVTVQSQALNSYDNFIIVIVALKCKEIRGFELIDIKKTSLYNKFICLKSYGGSYERNQL